MKKNEYNKKIQVCEILGAKKFQKIVLKVESFKWIVIKKLIPNYIKYGDKLIEYNRKKKIKSAKTQHDIDNIKRNAMMQKMFIRKEYNNNKNINYHINFNNPSEFIRELKMNKSIHKKSLIANFVFLPILITLASMGFFITIPLVAYEIFSIFINFQCINIQNYNIYRIMRIQKKLKLKEQKIENNNIKSFKSAYEVIGRALEEKKDIIDINELLNKDYSKEQLIQLKELIKREKMQRKDNIKIKDKEKLKLKLFKNMLL